MQIERWKQEYLNVKLILDDSSKVLVGNTQGLLGVFVHDVCGEELLQVLAHLALHKGGGGGEGIRCGLELFEAFERHTIAGC